MPDAVEQLVANFSLATGLPMQYVGVDGVQIRSAGHESACAFCHAVMSCGEGAARCRMSILEGGRQAARFGEPYVMRCHTGLVSVFVPVQKNALLAGALECGPMMLWDWDEMAVTEFLERTADLPIPPQALLVNSHAIATVSAARVGALGQLLHTMAAQMTDEGLSEQHEKQHQQALLWELITQQKRAGASVAYPLDMERDLMARVRLSDRAGAKRVLNQLLGRIFYATSDVSIIKARVLELVVMISRSAVESGASLEKLLGLNYNFISELSDIELFENLCAWVVKVLDTFLDAVTETRPGRASRVLEEALSYVREHYQQDLTLESVAKYVSLSPYYLSHLLRREYGFTFVNYVTRVRVEEARALLLRDDVTISSVSAAVGYDDPGYFTKVFRRVTGMTPGAYRATMKKG